MPVTSMRIWPSLRFLAARAKGSKNGTLGCAKRRKPKRALDYPVFGIIRSKKEPTGLAGGSSSAPVRLCYQQRPNRRIANLASAFLLLAARKRATRVGKAKLRTQFILFQLFLYVIPNLLFVLAYRIHVVAPAPEFTIAVFELQIAKSFIQHQAAFTLQITP